MPLAMASTSMKLIGMKRPMKNINAEMVNMVNLKSLKGSTKTRSLNLRGVGGKRDLTVEKAISNIAKIMKAIVRLSMLAVIWGVA